MGWSTAAVNRAGVVSGTISNVGLRSSLDHRGGRNWQFTILAGNPKDAHIRDGLVVAAYWEPDVVQAEFSGADLANQPDRARLRASVMGEIEA